MVFDEELLINCNRVLQRPNLSIDPNRKDKLSKSLETKSFLTIGDVGIYRKEQRVTPIFDKKGIDSTNTPSESIIKFNAEKEIEKRIVFSE